MPLHYWFYPTFIFMFLFLFCLFNKNTSNINLQLKKQWATILFKNLLIGALIYNKHNLNNQLSQDGSIIKNSTLYKFPKILVLTTIALRSSKNFFHELFGYLDYGLASMILPNVYCLQLQKIIENLPQYNRSIDIPITSWFWKGENIFYLAEICFNFIKSQ
ncbi:unnamed protein product [Paramecium sonneborni]|uniref:Uncharacterized protein n=1 Tax=Paramecium sonneborni TaxID=65129 RepID=A0A8S1QM53_9CILI|nr:unnamed protein product [Paramecium sonneborni]